MRIYKDIYRLIISPENLFAAWRVFKDDKGKRADVAEFEVEVEKHIFQLFRDLANKRYRHGPYFGFWIRDPKIRRIHKATVRDRVLHHAIFRVLNPIFEPTFIPTSFSCRVGKGTHKGVTTAAEMLRAESRNNTRICYALKCDIRKFFDSVVHKTLLEILESKIKDPDCMGLFRTIIESYSTAPGCGIPIGNLTSQLFANVYMNEFDHFVKSEMKEKRYLRYTDDFLIISSDKAHLQSLIEPMQSFLKERLGLTLHPNKISIRKFNQGIDFLGYVIRPAHILLRTKTRHRMFRKLEERVREYKNGAIREETMLGALRSYRGVLSHANAYQLTEYLENEFWFWLKE